MGAAMVAPGVPRPKSESSQANGPEEYRDSADADVGGARSMSYGVLDCGRQRIPAQRERRIRIHIRTCSIEFRFRFEQYLLFTPLRLCQQSNKDQQ
jgi:hypothetical protein